MQLVQVKIKQQQQDPFSLVLISQIDVLKQLTSLLLVL